MRGRVRSRLTITAAGVGIASVAGSLAIAAGGPAELRPSSTGNDSELVETVPITSSADRGRRVVMSLSPRRLGELRSRDRLRISSELQVTTDCLYRSARCAGDPYEYSPVVDVKLILARSERTTGGPGARVLAPKTRDRCRQGYNNREHHCVITIQRLDYEIARASRLPCSPASCRINLVVDAHHPRARGDDVLVIGANKPDGRILQDRGRINVIRLRGGRALTRSRSTSHRRTRAARLDGEGRVVHSIKLGGLQPRDSLAARAVMVTKIHHLPYNVRTSAQLVLARRRSHIEPRGWVRRALTLQGEATERNGFNCTQSMRRCALRKAGLVTTRGNWDRISRSRPVYLNLVMRVNPKRVSTRPGDRVRVSREGSTSVLIHRQPR